MSLVAVVILAALPTTAVAQQAAAPGSLNDPRLNELRVASVSWDNRLGPSRKVVDQVCFVPDLPTFLAVIATWDSQHWFPILIDDTELDLKFLRAFRPARVVRFPKAVPAVAQERLWDAAVAAVGQSRAARGTAEGDAPSGEAVPPGELGPTPPGVVVSSPASPSLAGAIALAAGRFQPLLRWEPEKGAADSLSSPEADRLVFDLETKVIALIPGHDRLGDDCDFITLAGDYPFRAEIAGGPNAGLGCFDDRLARTGNDQRRWAYTGRLIGDPAESVYRAMCSLFLQPKSVLLFNGYEQQEAPWTDYAMGPAARRLAATLTVVHRSGVEQSGLAGWHRIFDPVNTYGLILMNSHGQPSTMSLAGQTGQTADVPLTEPTAVVTIHSFSAVDPWNLETLAGRWLANGAFVYFGSMNEPFLPSFRAPTLVADLIAEGLPLSAATRQGRGEPFNLPWRLVYLGDPLYRVRPGDSRAARIDPAETAAWPAYKVYKVPDARATDDVKLAWALQAAIALAGGRRPAPAIDLPGILLSIRPERLSLAGRRPHAALLVDVLMASGRRRALIERLAEIRNADADVRRWLQTARTSELQHALAAGNLAEACAAWDALVRSEASDELKSLVTTRVAALADSPSRLRVWRQWLFRATPKLVDSTIAPAVHAELKRVESVLGLDKVAPRRPGGN